MKDDFKVLFALTFNTFTHNYKLRFALIERKKMKSNNYNMIVKFYIKICAHRTELENTTRSILTHRETSFLLSHPHPLYHKWLNCNWTKTRPVADRLISVVHYNKLVHSTMTLAVPLVKHSMSCLNLFHGHQGFQCGLDWTGCLSPLPFKISNL